VDDSEAPLEILRAMVTPAERTLAASWVPRIGDETARFLDRWNPPSRDDCDNALNDAQHVISQAVGPMQPPAHRTVLAVGQVQSGKTLSFTLVTTLARDNHFGMVVVIAGSGQYLFRQSEARLRKDLDLEARPDPRAWRHLSNPTKKDAGTVAAVLEEWRSYPTDRQTVLVTVMKNHTRLTKLTAFLEALDLAEIPVLMIDDEADQASPNTRVAQNEESATYRELMAVRAQIAHHSYLQYTATPQAPLLVQLADTLSPDRVHVIRPGDAYTGGKTFFVDHPELVVTIPEDELPIRGVPLRDPPPSLITAFALFVVGVGAGYAASGGRPASGNRSMMIHPAQELLPHAEFRTKIQRLKDDWSALLDDPTDPEYIELKDRLALAWNELSHTAKDLTPLDEILPHLARAVRGIRVEELNTSMGAALGRFDWKTDYAWILVGGNALDRGFTVEGLTITYMPRPKGVGHADTLEQRARFFGYRQSYLGFCRIFLAAATRSFYEDYVEHDRVLLTQLSDLGDKPLKTWTRIFVLDPKYKPTRQSVVAHQLYRENFAETPWFHSSPLFDREASEANDRLLGAFLDSVPASKWEETPGHAGRTPIQLHEEVAIALDDVLTLMSQLIVAEPADARRHLALLAQLGLWRDDHGQKVAKVYRMSKGHLRRRGTDKDLAFGDDDLRIENLFQGQNPRAGRGEVIYPGDRYYLRDAWPVMQIHNIHLGPRGVLVVAMQLPEDARPVLLGVSKQ
jgi:hypothetical protein